MRVLRNTLLVALCLAPGPSFGQALPAETPTFVGGRVSLGGEFTITGSPDDPGRFNDTDYQRNALQLIRFGVTALVRPFERFTLVTELRAEGDTAGGPWTTTPYAAYVRVRPWRDRAIDVQAGRIPPVFGVAGRRVYATGNVLIGYPLAWQYLTVLRSDAIPADADALIYARSVTGLSYYPPGAYEAAAGVPLATAFRYDTGVEVRVGDVLSPVSVSAAVTAGTLSKPGVSDGNGGPQFSTRVALHPSPGFVSGVSFADGPFLADGLDATLPETERGRRHAQRTWGADAEYSAGHWLVRAEVVLARWDIPVSRGPATALSLRSTAFSLEGRYRLQPGLTVAGRFDRMGFNTIQGTYTTAPWDAPVWRIETGVAYALTRHLIARFSVQHDQRDRGRVLRSTLAAVQGTLWF
jgi:hypothetical protein